ncbi:hypothetical protein [uncultured Methylovirgula sp.]|uniref:hypothetical protein n=1 Tax=uncultured Methylovirgula sp. TaxID=1285960 RepID=UPI0026214534|nr:hypothetical protein [uncultured Methylovirgula sp.]
MGNDFDCVGFGDFDLRPKPHIEQAADTNPAADQSMKVKTRALKYLDVALHYRDCKAVAIPWAEQKIKALRSPVDIGDLALNDHIRRRLVSKSLPISCGNYGIIGIMPKAALRGAGFGFGGEKIDAAHCRGGLRHEAPVTLRQQPSSKRWRRRGERRSRRESKDWDPPPAIRPRQGNDVEPGGERPLQSLARRRREIRIGGRRPHRFDPGDAQEPAIPQGEFEPLVDRGRRNVLAACGRATRLRHCALSNPHVEQGDEKRQRAGGA